MIKGHVQIELHNHKTGSRERIEGDNMVTNALNYVIPNALGGNHSPDSIMPLCKKALGGLMLFDGTLTEDKNNMFFPAEAHLVASANRGLDTSHSDRGSLNTAETMATDTGYMSVWDFSTSQANGTIKSLALTLNNDLSSGFTVNTPFNLISSLGRNGVVRDSDGSTNFNLYPLCYDVSGQNLYYIDPEKGGVKSRTEKDEDTGKNVTKYSTELHIMKVYLPTSMFGLGDDANVTKYGTEVTTITVDTGTNSNDCRSCFRNGYDGYAYMVTPIGTNGQVDLVKMKVSDYSFETDDAVRFEAKSCSLYNYYGYSTVSKGYAYLQSLDRRSIYIVNLANTVDIQQVNIPNDFTINSIFTAMKNGGIKFGVSKKRDGSSYYDYKAAICYPDGKVILNQTNSVSTSYDPIDSYVKLITDNLMVFGCSAYGWASGATGYLLNNYLGTIYNLPQPIVKTAASSMKVVYTLTNTD